MKITVRREEPADYQTVYSLIQEAFASAEHADGDEQELVVRLRKGPAFVSALSLVAEAGGRLAGHILFTEIRVGDTVQLALAPLSVLPELQRKGIGGALVRAGHEVAAGLGYEYAVVLGSERFYPRFGYRPAVEFGILPPFPVPEENFMARNLQGRKTRLMGAVVYPPEFGI